MLWVFFCWSSSTATATRLISKHILNLVSYVNHLFKFSQISIISVCAPDIALCIHEPAGSENKMYKKNGFGYFVCFP